MSPKTTTPKTQTLTIERLFNATPERLWSYWTDPKKYAKWLNPAPGLDLVVHEWDARPGGRVRFDMPQPDGNPNPQEGVFHSLDPYREIVSGDADRSFLIRVTFEPVGNQTRMTVTVTGLPAEYHGPATKGWNAGFDKLERALATGSDAAHPTPGPRGFTIERMLGAPPEKVWAMWTTRAGLEQWFCPDGYTSRVTKLDLRVAGEYAIEMTSRAHTAVNHGVYVEISPPRRLAMVWRFDIFLQAGEKAYDVPITVELAPAPGGGTKMTFTQGPLATTEHTEGSRQGVLSNFGRLAKAVEA